MKNHIHMKRVLINSVKVVLFALVMYVVISKAYKIISWKDTTGDYLSSMSQMYHTSENQIDAIFLGSSHCYCSIYPAYMWRDAGYAAFDMAASGQDKISGYHALAEVLKTQKPKVVCVDMFGLTYDKHGIEGNLYRNILPMKLSKNSVELVQDFIDEEQQKDFILKWPIVHTRYTKLGKYDFKQYQPSIYGRGADFLWETVSVPLNFDGADTIDMTELSTENENWLHSLYELSQEKGFQLIFFVAPYQISYEQQTMMNSACAFAAERNIPFFDFNELRFEIGLDGETDFCDEGHCNALGAEKVTAYFTKYLTANYELEDHRGDEAYEVWDIDYDWYRHMEEAAKLKRTDDAMEYMEKIYALDDSVTVISLEAGFDNRGDYYYDLLNCLGIPRDESELGGKWVFCDGEVTKVLENDPEAPPFIMDLSDDDTLRICYEDQLMPGNIRINMEEYSQEFYCLTILTYDRFTGEVIESRGF